MATRKVTILPIPVREYHKVLKNDPCCYCGGVSGTIDHIESKYVLRKQLTTKQVKALQSGKHFQWWQPNRWENLTGACGECNVEKGVWPLLVFMTRRVATAKKRRNGANLGAKSGVLTIAAGPDDNPPVPKSGTEMPQTYEA